MTSTADIVVIGGGVHGSSLAFHLAAAGAGQVVLLEKHHIASGPTAQSGAMIRPLFNDRIYVDLVIASTRMFESWNEIVGGEIINPPHQFPFLTSLQRNWPANP